jgi:hypothetical protein
MIEGKGKNNRSKKLWISTLLGIKFYYLPTFLTGISASGGIVGFTTAETKA